MSATRAMYAIGAAVTFGALITAPANACTHAGPSGHTGGHNTATHSGTSYTSDHTATHSGGYTGYTSDHSGSYTGGYTGGSGTGHGAKGGHGSTEWAHPAADTQPAPTPSSDHPSPGAHGPCPHHAVAQHPSSSAGEDHDQQSHDAVRNPTYPHHGDHGPHSGWPTAPVTQPVTSEPVTTEPGTDEAPSTGSAAAPAAAPAPAKTAAAPAPAKTAVAAAPVAAVAPAAAVLSTGSATTPNRASDAAVDGAYADGGAAAPTVIDAGEQHAVLSQAASSPWGIGLVAFGAVLVLGAAVVARRRT